MNTGWDEAVSPADLAACEQQAAEELAALLPGLLAVMVRPDVYEITPDGREVPIVRVVRPDSPVPDGFIKVAFPPCMPSEEGLSLVLRLCMLAGSLYGREPIQDAVLVCRGLAFGVWVDVVAEERSLSVRVSAGGARISVYESDDPPPAAPPACDGLAAGLDPECALDVWAVKTVLCDEA